MCLKTGTAKKELGEGWAGPRAHVLGLHPCLTRIAPFLLLVSIVAFMSFYVKMNVHASEKWEEALGCTEASVLGVGAAWGLTHPPDSRSLVSTCDGWGWGSTGVSTCQPGFLLASHLVPSEQGLSQMGCRDAASVIKTHTTRH